MVSNLKTTILGFLVAFLNLYANGVSVRQAALSAAIVILGAMAKDFNATGGTKPVTHESEARVEDDKEFKFKTEGKI